MAVKILTPQKGDFNKITTINFEAATTVADGMEFKLPSRDMETYILVQNTDASNAYTITVKAPANQGYTSASTDLVKSIPKSGFAIIKLESAVYADKGLVKLIPQNVAIKAAVIY